MGKYVPLTINAFGAYILSSNNFLLILICLETTCLNEINETSIKHMSVKKL